SQFHSSAKSWWEACLSGPETVAIPWVVSLGFVRLVTNPRIFLNPIPVQEATHEVRLWLEQPQVQILQPGPRHATIVLGYLDKVGAGGNLTTDAHLAALAVEYQAALYTSDVDFSRFAGLRWINPLD
ncbi:MAG: TA system VapC family ribonuclease toxin, partial [Bryobacteraceae bacterium]